MVRIPVAILVLGAAGVIWHTGCDLKPTPQYVGEEKAAATEDLPMVKTDSTGKMVKSDAEWRRELTAQQYYIMREKGTERAFTGIYDDFFEPGQYLCAACGAELFGSDAKYNSGCGWPAFTRPAEKDRVEYTTDTSHGMIRTEVTCSRCGGHLGHVFNDGPQPAGQRYCINSAALKFKKQKRE